MDPVQGRPCNRFGTVMASSVTFLSVATIKRKSVFTGLRIKESARDHPEAEAVEPSTDVELSFEENNANEQNATNQHSSIERNVEESVEESMDDSMGAGEMELNVKDGFQDPFAEEEPVVINDVEEEEQQNIQRDEEEDGNVGISVTDIEHCGSTVDYDQSENNSSSSEEDESDARQFKQSTPCVKEEEDSLFDRYHRKLNELMPFHFPGRPKSFNDYLNGKFEKKDYMGVERLDIQRRCSGTTTLNDNKLRALVALSFPPVLVGELAGKSVPVTFQGDMFPQFSQKEKSNFNCEFCIPFQKWAMENGKSHA